MLWCLPNCTQLPDVSRTPVLSSAIGECDDQAVRTTLKAGKAVQKLDSKVLSTYEDPAYMDLPEINDKRGSGMKILPLLLKVSQRCQKKMEEKPTDRVRCIGSKGCAQTWAHPRNRQRILAHASKCNWLPTELREAALEQMANNAIGPVAEITPSASTSRHSLAHGSPTMANNNTYTPSASPPEKNPAAKKMFHAYVTEGRQELKDKADFAVMQYIVCCGIPPKTVDADEFKFMISTLNSRYQPPSSSTLSSKLIPNEAAKLSLAAKQHLAKCHHLTITFDGGKTRQPHSVYTIHVTTGDRRTFCLDMDDASRLSHSAEYIFEALDRVRTSHCIFIPKSLKVLLFGFQVVTKIGPWRFCATSSDNTGNTRKARKLLCQRYPNILNLQDACHLLSLGIKAIALLPEFENVIRQICTILAFMSRSSYAMEHFDYQRNQLGIARGLEGIGETQFGTIYWAGRSLQRGLPALRAIVEDENLGINITVCTTIYHCHSKVIFNSHHIQSSNELFQDGTSRLTFEFELAKLLSVTGPWAKALKCLESAHVTADNVYLYWLAIMATIEDDLKKNPYNLKNSTMEDIRAIANSRFNEMIEDAPNDTYIVAFFLNPGMSPIIFCYRCSKKLKR